MLHIGKSVKVEKIDEVIDELLDNIRYEENAEKLAKMTEAVETLYRARSHADKTRRVSADTIAVIIANLGGIGLILSYEKFHVITSKALSFVAKTRL